MKLKEVQIKDFLSIKSAVISFSPSCRILVGINESGKSNILKALRMLDPSVTLEKKYTRDIGANEDVLKESEIDFVFTFENEDFKSLFEEIKPKFLFLDDTPIIASDSGKLNLAQLINSITDSIYSVDILKQKRTYKYYPLGSKYKPLPNLKKVSENCPKGLEIESKKDNKKYVLTDFQFINTDDFILPDSDFLIDIKEISEIGRLIGSSHSSFVQKNLPVVTFWEYNDSNLLPSKINLESFIANPKMCEPLERMFNLAGYETSKILTEINDARAISPVRLSNLLKKVADKNTQYFKNVWKEYPDVSFDLRTDGPDIIATIKDTDNNYDLNQRSDGFKRFITFLLLISTQTKINSLKKSLIIVDEPEIGLHPTGASFLKDELIKISQTNLVAYSTHSIFMIDQKDISRHYIVKKKREVTKIEVVKESNIQDEEVIYKSLGYSIFSNLKEWNIIFEGWRDKDLFIRASETSNTVNRVIFDDLKKVGYCHSQGVKHIQNITPAFEAGNRKCLILSDADFMAKDKKREYEKNKGFGFWYTYHDIDESFKLIFTAEDFFEDKYFIDQINTLLTDKLYPSFVETDINHDKGKIESVRAWCGKKSINKEDCEVLISELKDLLLTNLKPSNLIELYFDYLSKVNDLIKSKS